MKLKKHTIFIVNSSGRKKFNEKISLIITEGARSE
jgi:hypothetical protein